jgi:hypothetical protein
MCLRFVFLLVTRLAAWSWLCRREECWNDAEILLLRHQVSACTIRRVLKALKIPRASPLLHVLGVTANPDGRWTPSRSAIS